MPHGRQLSSIIALTLAAAAGAASLGGCCGNERMSFVVDSDITERDVERILEDQEYWGSSTTVTCEDVCEYIDGNYVENDYDIEWCQYVLEDADEDTDPGDVVGHVDCYGTTSYVCTGGRKPLGHMEPHYRSAQRLGAYFAASAHLEAASVFAFDQLAKQLQAWGAPKALLRRCREAAEDEVLHARLMGDLAMAEGAVPPKPELEATEPSMLDVALHNAVEGCVVETWAALLARYQATHARRPEWREVFERIAIDEARHAQLSWDLYAWFIEQLSEEDALKVALARREALAGLERTARTQAQLMPRDVGIPPPHEAVALASTFATMLERA